MLFVFFCNVCSVAVKLPRLGFLPFVGRGGGGGQLLNLFIISSSGSGNGSVQFCKFIFISYSSCSVCLFDCLSVWLSICMSFEIKKLAVSCCYFCCCCCCFTLSWSWSFISPLDAMLFILCSVFGCSVSPVIAQLTGEKEIVSRSSTAYTLLTFQAAIMRSKREKSFLFLFL